MFLTLHSMLVSSHQQSPSTENDEQHSDSIPGVITLNSRDFDSSISDGNRWLIEFYSPWCGHCKRFAPTYESVAKTLHGSPERKIKVAKIDGSEDIALASRFSVRGFPTFYLIDGWDVYEYQDTRTRDKLINFATNAPKEHEPMSFISSPLGPFGRVRGLTMNIGIFILDTYNYLTKEKSMSPAAACLIMSSVGIVIGVFIIIGFGLFLVSNKPKMD